MEVLGGAAPVRSDIGPPRLSLVLGGAYASEVRDERELLEELLVLLNQLADRADPVRATLLRAWSRTVRQWLRFGPR
jgi:hypothetical protein